MRVGVYLGGHVFSGRVTDFVNLARVAEDVGLDDVALGEHVVLGEDNPTPPWGRFVHRVDEPFPEPLTTLAVIAGATQRIRLITAILIAPLRPAVVLAKQVATLHALSGGRLALGISTSWHADEYTAAGIPFEQRGQRLDDIVGACRALWGAQPASFTSPTVNFNRVHCEPRPAHPDDIPLWFTGKMRKQLVRRIAASGHGWLPFLGADTPLEPFADDINAIKEAMRRAGRDVEAEALEVAVRFRAMGRSLEQAFAQDIPIMQAAGITETHVPLLSLVNTLDDAPKALEHIARVAAQYQ